MSPRGITTEEDRGVTTVASQAILPEIVRHLVMVLIAGRTEATDTVVRDTTEEEIGEIGVIVVIVVIVVIGAIDVVRTRSNATTATSLGIWQEIARKVDVGVMADRPMRATECYNCRKEGHIARDCPEGNTGDRRKEIDCRNCHELGHYARDCPSIPSFTQTKNELDYDL